MCLSKADKTGSLKESLLVQLFSCIFFLKKETDGNTQIRIFELSKSFTISPLWQTSDDTLILTESSDKYLQIIMYVFITINIILLVTRAAVNIPAF